MFCFIFLVSIQWRESMAQWTSAHATFYGGSDASGTMGELLFWVDKIMSAYISVCNYNLNKM